MSYLTWQEKFSVGIEQIDRDHKILFDLVGQFHDAYAMGKGETALEQLLDMLVDYTTEHFNREEEMMRVYEYPDLERHTKSHRALANEVEGMQKRFQAGERGQLCLDMLGFLNNWLTLHILETDRAYQCYFESQGIDARVEG